MRKVISALVISAVCAACTEAPTGTVQTALPRFDAAHAQSTSGPNVVRGPFQPGVLSGPDGQLAVAVGFDAPFAAHCSDLESPNQPGTATTISTPKGGKQLTQSGKNLSVVVFQFNGQVGDYCLDLALAPVVATGTADFTLTSNDLVLGGSGPGADNVNVTIHGVVNLTSGGQARLFATTHVLIKPDGSFAHDHTRITLTPL